MRRLICDCLLSFPHPRLMAIVSIQHSAWGIQHLHQRHPLLIVRGVIFRSRLIVPKRCSNNYNKWLLQWLLHQQSVPHLFFSFHHFPWLCFSSVAPSVAPFHSGQSHGITLLSRIFRRPPSWTWSIPQRKIPFPKC